MAQAPRRTALSGPTLVRLLARLTETDVPESGQSLSDRLSRWLGWTDAIALSTALSLSPPAVPSDAQSAAGKDAESLCARVRTALANAIAGSGETQGRRSGTAQAPARSASTDTAADYADFRQRYLVLQQTMQVEIGELRARLRRMLSARTPGMARLAVLDASLEQALDAHERHLLASVPTLLGTHFERLRKAERQRLANAHAPQHAAAASPGAWLDVFRKDMQSVLLAELEIRFQPVEGLLAALRTR